MTRFSKIAAVMAAVPVLAVSGSALAGSPGQMAQGNNLYMVKNLTQGGSYAKTISATCNDEVQYSMELANTGYASLNNITLKATMPSAGGVSTFTATTDLGGNSGTHDSVTVNLGSNQTQTLENGTTVLYDSNAHAIKTLSDTITSGLNLGTLNGSTTEFVNFKAKVSCPTPTPPQVSLACVELDVANIDRTHYDFTAKGSVQNANITGYTFTVKDANSKVLDTNSVSTSATSAVYHFNQEAGTYTVSAQLNTDHGSTSSNNCVKQITVATPPTTPVTPTTPAKTLPNTGAGDVLGIFTGASSLGAVGHYVTSRRKRGL